jgi:tetratricopeptide (TPR) repeat protein
LAGTPPEDDIQAEMKSLLAAALSRGNELVEHGDFSGARALYRQVLDSGDREFAVLAAFKLEFLLERQGDQKTARRTLSEALDIHRTSHRPFTYEDALADLDEAEQRVLKALDNFVSRDEVQVASAALIAPGQASAILRSLRSKGLVEVEGVEGQERYRRAAGVQLT